MSATEAVAVEGLSKRFGRIVAVDNLSFRLETGTITGLLGPNGAGKTTTFRMLLGLAEPTAGSARVLGRRYRELPHPPHRIGAVLEAADFHPGRSGRDHLRSLARAARISDARVDETLGLVGLTAVQRRRVKTYSLGMRQRLGLAAALLGDPDLLILDEPANGLDPEGVAWLRSFLRSFVGMGKTVLVSSHVLAEVAQTVDQVVIINRGRLVTFAPLAELTARMAGTVRVRTPEVDRLRAALKAQGIASAPRGPEELSVEGASSARVGEIASASSIVLHELVAETSTLEEVFLELTAKDGT